MSIKPPANKPFHDRMRLSAGVNYVLRLMRTYTDLVGGDPTTALVFIAAAQACTQHVKVRPEALQEETFIRDEMRRPVSLSALARSLGLPIETTRRHVLRLVEAGLAERADSGGVLVTSRQLGGARVRAAVSENNINLARLQSELAAVG